MMLSHVLNDPEGMQFPHSYPQMAPLNHPQMIPGGQFAGGPAMIPRPGIGFPGMPPQAPNMMPPQVRPAVATLPEPAKMGGSSGDIRANVIQIAGCLDVQSGQELDISGLPPAEGRAKSGGACSMAALKVLANRDPRYNYRHLLVDMSKILRSSGYTQTPMLGSSGPIDLDMPVVVKPDTAARTKALLIGINYTGQGDGELLGSHNDVDNVKKLITGLGFDTSWERMRILKDDGVCTNPTKNNIWEGLRWLIKDAKPDDCLFLHFSGHGGQVKDISGDEVSGFDQTLIPVDHKNAGIILDDDILAKIIKPLPKGVDMFCIMDCCHSGTIMDLPYSISVDPRTGQALSMGQIQRLGENQRFKNKGKTRDMGGKEVGCAAMAAGCGLCCADATDMIGDSDKPGGSGAPGCATGTALFCTGCMTMCVDVTDLCGDSKKRGRRC